jgi:hypothetical protein
MALPPAPKLRSRRWSDSLLTLPVLSIRQPYAWLVVTGIKDIENRSRRVNYRGPILIHASRSMYHLNEESAEKIQASYGIRIPREYDIGGVVGMAEIVDCVRTHPSVWKDDDSWGWVLTNARPLPFRECKGAVGFFYPKWS